MMHSGIALPMKVRRYWQKQFFFHAFLIFGKERGKKTSKIHLSASFVALNLHF